MVALDYRTSGSDGPGTGKWLNASDASGATITDFGGARISDELALKKRRIQFDFINTISELIL